MSNASGIKYLILCWSILGATTYSDVAHAQLKQDVWANFQKARSQFRNGEIDQSKLWQTLHDLQPGITKIEPKKQAVFLQSMAGLLRQDGYFNLAAIYAAQALRVHPNPISDTDSKETAKSWQTLADISKKHAIQNILELVAIETMDMSKNPPFFVEEWNYIRGNQLQKDKKLDEALRAYKKVPLGSRYFLAAKFQEAMIHLTLAKPEESISSLRLVLNPNSQEAFDLSPKELRDATDLAKMALGRIYYEQQKFNLAIQAYRTVSKEGKHFYDALFEQSWALLMSGFPNHALGMIHSVRSPFFSSTFNPEATMLASLTYFWMCRYDDSRNELASFLEEHQEGIEKLDSFLSRKDLTPSNLYTLFENTVTGVSSESLELPRKILVHAANKDSMRFVREQYANLLEEYQRLNIDGVFGNKDATSLPRKFLEQWSSALKTDLGARYLRELQSMHKDFQRLSDQASFLYVELLMSQKDQLLGKELHKEKKLTNMVKNQNIRGWAKQAQSWAADDRKEYWYDELGYHIIQAEPLCK